MTQNTGVINLVCQADVLQTRWWLLDIGSVEDRAVAERSVFEVALDSVAEVQVLNRNTNTVANNC